jgi:hypothetical protein
MVACEASRAREHGHDSKQEHQVEGPIMQAKEWTRVFRRCNSWSTRAQKSQRGDDSAGRKNEPGGPEPPQAGLPYKRHPSVPVFCRQVALSFLCLCAQVFVLRTTIDIAILPELDCSNNSHPYSTQSPHSEVIFEVPSYRLKPGIILLRRVM